MNEADDPPQQLLRVDARGRVRTSPEHRESILDEFEGSGISGAAFARLHGIKYATFANWVQKRRRQQSQSSQCGPGRPRDPGLALAEVVLAGQSIGPGARPEDSLRIELPGSAAISVSNRRQAQLAAELLHALSSC